MSPSKFFAFMALIVSLANAQTPTDVSDANSQTISLLVVAAVMMSFIFTVSAQTPTDVSSALSLAPYSAVLLAVALAGLRFLM